MSEVFCRETAPGRKRRRLPGSIRAALWLIVGCSFIEAFLLQPLRVVSDSMAPAIAAGRVVFVWKLAYGLRVPLTRHYLFQFHEGRHAIQRGDVVLVKLTKDEIMPLWQEMSWSLVALLPTGASSPIHQMLKRVAGLGGDKVEIKDKRLIVNDQPVTNDRGSSSSGVVLPEFFNNRDNFGPVTVPEGMLFLLGDNRDQSWDSRAGIFFSATSVLGKIIVL